MVRYKRKPFRGVGPPAPLLSRGSGHILQLDRNTAAPYGRIYSTFELQPNCKVALLHEARFNMIFIRVKRIGAQCSPMCAMISFGSTENEMRFAVEECANNLEYYERAARNGGRYPISKSSQKYLESHHIQVIDKVHENFPDAIYWCSLCDFHMTDIQHVRAHFDANQHFPEEQRISERKDLLERMPPMSDNQLKAINILIEQMLQDKAENGQAPLWQQHMEVAKKITDVLNRHVFEKMGVTGQVAVYGSALTRTCIENSDLNVAIDIPSVDCSDAVETMKSVADHLKVAPDLLDVQFSTDIPMCIKLTLSNVCVRIAWRCENGVKYAKLISVYSAIRPQFAELCRIVRKWAEVSGIYSADRRKNGLTSYGFDIMVLYFLQQKGLLPCLHEMRPLMSHEKKSEPTIDDYYENRELYESDVDVITEKIGPLDEPWDLARLFVDFLCFYGSRVHQNEVVQVYTAKHVIKDRSRWSRKLLQICDPFRTDNVVTFTKAYQVYFFNCFLKSYLYFAIPQTTDGPLLDVTLYQKETSTVHDIRLKDLTPENVEIDDYMVYSRRTMQRIRDRNPTRISRHLYMILDEKYNLANREFKERDKEVDELLGLRREKIRHEKKRERLRAQISKRVGNEVDQVQEDLENCNPFDDVRSGLNEEDWMMSQDEESVSINAEVETVIDESIDEPMECTENAEAAEVSKVIEIPQVEGKGSKPQVCYENFFIALKEFDAQKLKQKVDELPIDQFRYSFDDSQNFNNGYKPDIVCSFCESSDHWSDVCPLMIIPPMEILVHEKEPYEWIELDRVIMGGYEKNRVKTTHINEVGDFVDRVRVHLQNLLKKPVRLHIFGSLLSGFGVANSDVDLCFRFQPDEQPLDIDGVEIVRQIAQHMQQMSEVENVYAITGAKVPIVKFNWKKLGVEGDISYYNVLALSNTEMLRKYCLWDRRVAPLGVWIKRWAKSCDIGDASRGSLSSYAFIILLLHYLQNCDPPDFRDNNVQPIMVENCDVYFHREVIADWSQNRQSISELFVGFLDYYARFDFGTQVVQIRRKKPLLKMEKDWNRSLCIEDPFDLHHNLGSGVSRKMFVFIVRNIHKSRKVFMLSDVRTKFLEGKKHTAHQEMPLMFCDAYAATLLRECQMGAAPTDRQCRICHRIGHFAESCQNLRNGNGQRPLRRNELWTKRKPNGNGGSTPRSGQPFGSRTNASLGGRVFYRPVMFKPRVWLLIANIYDQIQWAVFRVNVAVLTANAGFVKGVTCLGLPIVALRNDLNGSALQYIRLTSTFDAFSPYIYKNKLGVMEISRAMKLHREDNSLNDHQLDLVIRFKLELEVHLSNYFGTRVMLAIYGSTLNGFGTRSCDVDMSMSFPAGPPAGKVVIGGVVCPDLVMREVAKALVDYPNARDEQYICAKVPIVRFRGKDMDIEADISYRNDLALHNTQLLRQYCKWDEDRLPTLGIWVKTGGSPADSQYVNGWNVDFWKFVDVGGCGLVIIWNLRPIQSEKAYADTACHKILARIQHQAGVNCVRWSHDGDLLACASDDKVITIYEYGGRVQSAGSIGSKSVMNVEKYRLTHTLHTHSMEVLSVEWSSDRRYLASASMDNTVVVWNAKKLPERIVVLDTSRGGHNGPVKGLSWDPIGKYLATQSADK
ncbi:phage tail component protein, partial [Teladorsagia circumcincta]